MNVDIKITQKCCDILQQTIPLDIRNLYQYFIIKQKCCSEINKETHNIYEYNN